MSPAWLKYIVCIIIYNPNDDEVFLGKRPKGSAEAGKWAFLGGSGAFETSQSRENFALQELQYDLNIEVDDARLGLFKTIVLGDRQSLLIEDIFYYEADRKIRVSGRERAPEEGRWFSMVEIEEMNERGEMAFDNFKVLEEFAE